MQDVDQNTIFMIVLFVAAATAMKFMPRLIAGVPFVNASEVAPKLDADPNTVVIDVRTEAEFQKGHAKGAINLPLSDISTKMDQLGEQLAPYKSQPVYVMCRTENRAATASRMLKKQGFTNLRIVKGGFSGWKRQKYAVVE